MRYYAPTGYQSPVSGFQIINIGRFVTVVTVTPMLPPTEVNAPTVPVVHKNANIQQPVVGGEIVETGVVPDKIVRNDLGVIVAAEGIVTGFCWRLFCTVLKSWNIKSDMIILPSSNQ
jgi:hypothetical protein